MLFYQPVCSNPFVLREIHVWIDQILIVRNRMILSRMGSFSSPLFECLMNSQRNRMMMIVNCLGIMIVDITSRVTLFPTVRWLYRGANREGANQARVVGNAEGWMIASVQLVRMPRQRIKSII